MNTIYYVQLLFPDAENKRLLEKWIEKQPDLELSGEQKPDLLLVDGLSFRQNVNDLKHFQQQNKHTYLPIILFVRANDEAMAATSQVWEVVDDVINMPVNMQLLRSRLNIHLRTRRLTRDINKQRNVLFRIQQALESASDGIVILDNELNVIYANRQALRLVSPDANDFRAERLLQYEFDKAQTLGVVVSQVQADGETRSTQIRLKHDDQTYIVLLRIDRISDEQYGDANTIVVLTDITEFKRAKTARLRSEENLSIALKGAPISLFRQDMDLRYTWIHGPEEYGELYQKIVGKTDAEIGDDQQYVESLIELKQKAIQTRQTMEGEVIGRWNNQVYHFRVVVKPIMEDGEVTGVSGSALNITTTKLAQERASTLQYLTSNLSEAWTIKQIAQVITQQALRIFGAEYGGVALINSDGTHLAYITTDQMPEYVGQTLEVSLTHKSPLVDAYITGQIVFVSDRQEYEQQYPKLFADYKAHTQSEAMVAVPMRTAAEVFGVITISFVKPQSFTEDDLEFYQAVADQCAIAIDRARLAQRSRELAITRERYRISRELHDAVSQLLFSAQIMCEAVIRSNKYDAAKLEEIYQLLRGAQSEMRILLLELRPDHLERGNVQDQLQHLITALQTQQGHHIEFMAEEAEALPSEVKVTIFRVAQAAITNILRHAKATNVTVQFEYTGKKAHLLIKDDGIGFDLDQVHAGLGLKTMRERASLIDAQLEFASGEGGTTITLIWNAEDALSRLD